ncbi:TPA: isopeptide-forming domain-containing fimbrial protein [Streptococcus suis]|nr:isopeptide-forming domain-containing fimbrial protein [Streptococcus suis]HEM5947152.1 isopeptide-forming domain-containing fimbrial protein [Streptococcus suis]HEM5951336.1 isopeptide-forming domain-containing fimbrial protein [Streptococcus suis]HEM5953321.1 isopeptide-forming domain-containing fimbrial protein [Streptococcus suis]HEM5959817.1 isopeptide-forming domain-containing fimbrial protein [Streptococcus suis]
MQSEKNRRPWKGLLGFFAVIGVLVTLLVPISSGMFVAASELGNVITSENTTTKATQDGCAIKIETTEKVSWQLPRQPIDLVIIQDASGSFEQTMPNIKEALKRVTETTTEAAYDEKNPKLVFTNNPDTTDRVMVTSYAGLDVARQYDDAIRDDYGNIYGTDSDFKVLAREVPQTKDLYRFDTNGRLLNSTEAINAEVNKIITGGGTPTVPAIEDAIKNYEAVKGKMTNGRKTVFLLVTDGIANGYREGNTVYIDRSMYRSYKLMNDWNTGSRMPEAAQNYLARAKELEEAGNKLKVAAGENGKVVVGFWEDKAKLQAFDTKFGYLYAYDNAFGTPGSYTTINTGDNRSIREVFTTALKSVASESDVLPTGEAADYYVEDTNINQFAAKILKSITAAITKEDVSGSFTVTEGYTVESVTINGKQVVPKVTDEKTQVRGTINQENTSVTITVPESVFNPGNNDFKYDLKRTEEAENLDEADEKEPPADYTPSKVEREVGQLVGKFKVGDFESAPIGSTQPTKVEVTDLKYCYPRATKDVKDQDINNDTNGDDGKSGIIAEDPLLKAAGISRQTYAATLSDQSELFTYSIRYNMYNAPLEMDRNVMLVDALDYRVAYQEAYVTDNAGKRLDDFKVSTKEITDDKGKITTIVYATVPPSPGEKTATINEGEYGGHKFKVYNLVIKAKIKDEYTFEKNENVYKSMMTENGGLGFLNQAQIVWNGNTDDPQDKNAKLRRSNAVYVVPPVKTDITKKVSQSQTADGADHLELPTRLDDYYYQISSTWPGLFDSYVIEDILVPELMSLHDADKEDKVFVNGKEAPTLTKYLKKETVEVEGIQRDRVYFELKSANLSRLELRRINAEIEKLNVGNDGPAKITLGIKARIRDNAVLAKYADKNGKIQVPNTANVILNNNSQTSNKVTVSPNSPAAIKFINEKEAELFTTVNKDGEGQAFNYDVQATLPSDITTANEYYIKDILDNRLELVSSGNAADADNDGVYMVGTDAEHFTTEVKTEDGKQVVYARLKESSFDKVKANDVIHLVIHARVKAGATGSIENTATVHYNGKPTPPTPPVVVTPPPTVTKTVEPTIVSREANLEDDQVPAGTYTAKINKEGEDIELAVWKDPYVYKVNSVIPKGATTFTIKDILIPEMELVDAVSDKNPRKVEIDVDGTKESVSADQIKVDKSDVNKQTIFVTLTEEQIAKYADKNITLTFTAKFKVGASLTKYISKENGLPKAPNTATIKINNNPEVKSNTVTVTPPVNKPEIKKTVNNKLHADLDGRYELFTYKIVTSVPYNASEFVITDALEPVLHFASDLSKVNFKIGDKTYTGDELAGIVKLDEKIVDGQKQPILTATLREMQIQGNEGKPVVIEFLAQVNIEADLSKYRYVKENQSERYGEDADHAEIPNEASYIINNNVKEVSNKVTVTPPAPTPSKLDKKIEDVYSKADPKPLVDHLDVENGKDYNYVIDATFPSNIFEYKSWMLEDTLDPRLELSDQDEPVIIAVHPDGAPASAEDEAYIKDHFNITIEDAEVDGKATKKVVVKVPEDKMKELHDKYQIRLYVPARIKDGVTDTNIPNDAIKTGIKPNGETHVVKTPPVTVTPPQEVPTPKKTVDNQEERSLATLEQEFTYRVAVTVPENTAGMSKFEISDDLEDILTVTDTAVTIDGQEDEKVSVTSTKDANDANGKVIAALPVDEIASYKGKEMILTIKACIKDSVSASELAKYVTATNQDGSIPNKATLTVGDKPEQKKDSNEVPVTPPGEEPNVSKKINETEDSALVLPESDYRYNIKSTLPKDISTYKKFVIVDEVDSRLAIQGTPVIKGDAADFFTVKVTGQTVTAEITDIAKAKAYAGEAVELVITAQVKKDATLAEGEVGIPNTSKVTYQNKNHVDGEPDSETPPTPPVTVTTPPVTKKINENLDHLDTATQTNYTYNIKTVLPTDIATYKRFVITDSLEGELAVQGIPTMTGDAAKFFDVKVDGQVVTATITDFEAAKAMAGKEVELVIVSQIREGVTRQAIPNQTTISYTNKAKADGTPGDVTTTPPTPPVTVTPPGEDPTVEKKINRDLTEAVVLPESNYTYNITSTLPVDITSYKAYAIVDELDENLSIQGTPVVTGDAAKFFDVTVTGNTVKATMRDFKQAKDLAGKQVELVITAQVKSTSTATKIDNTAKVTYQNKNHVDGEPDSETPPTPPVTVTTPPVTKKINENLDHLDTATQTNYTYNIKTVLPTDIANYKRFVITDSLEGELAVQGIPTMTGDAAKFFDVKVDGQVVTATITDFEAAKAMAGKEVELVIVSQIREGVTRQAIPNQTTISYTNKAKADGTPGDVTTTPPTPPVTVTPPGETPTVEKKINRDLDHLDIETEKDYNYNITTNLPVDIVSYKRYVLTDTLDQDLAIQGTPVITGEAAKFFDVTVEGQTVTATMKDFKQAKDLAGKQVELVITAQVREGITRPNIPNTAKVEFTNKSDQTGEKETKPVTVTPPTPNTPPIEKKVNGAASAELASRQEVFTYTIDTVVPTGAFAFEVNDTLEDVLAFEGEVTATLAGKALSANQITVAGQTVTVKLTKEQVRQQAGAPLQVVFFAKVKDGADLTPYMTDGRTSVPNTASYIINKDPSTKKDSNTVPVYPPTPNEPSVDKKINRDLTHLDVEVNKSYMYNVTADLPQDIATYKEFVVTDIVEPVLAINGEVVAYVDGYATDAVKVTVEGNRVVASVVDFSRLAGFKQIQLYIPAYIKSDADLTAYMKDNAASIPNTASLDFTDSNGVKKRKETTPVTVTPPTPDTPPTPPVNPPQPGTPVKTVSRVAGLEQTDYLALLLATENFRFDIKSVVPMDEADDKRLNLTSLTITDQMDNLFTVSPDKVAVKVTNAPTANANYIDEDVEKAQAALDVEVAKLEEIKQSAQTDTSAATLTEAQNLLATLEAEWTAAEAKLAELTTAELTEAPVETPAVDYASEIAAQEALMAELQAKLDEAKTQVQTAQAALSTAKTAAEVKVEVENQEKVVAEKQTVLDEAKKRQAIVQERIAQLANVNEKGELTAQAIVALGGSIKVEGQLVTVDFTDEYTMEALKGYTVNVIIYSSISDVDALTKDHFTIGIDNTATVQFNHDPSEQLTKKTNKVTVVPPKNDTPPPPPTTPEKPKGELPTPPTPPTTPPAESTPPPPGKTLPKTGVAENGMYALVGMILGTLTLVFRRRKQ